MQAETQVKPEITAPSQVELKPDEMVEICVQMAATHLREGDVRIARQYFPALAIEGMPPERVRLHVLTNFERLLKNPDTRDELERALGARVA